MTGLQRLFQYRISSARSVLAVSFLAGLAVAATPATSQAGWFTKLVREAADSAGDAGRAGRKASKLGSASLDNAAGLIRKVDAPEGYAPLAVEITPEGHFRFVNKAGDNFTAGSPDELSRAYATLLPDAAKGAVKIKPALYLTKETVFDQRALIKDLPLGSARRAKFFVVIGKKNYPLVTRGSGDTARAFAQVKSNILLEMVAPAEFAEALWQMKRQLWRADIRLLSLQPGEARVLSSVAKPRKRGASIVPELVDPFALAKSMSSIRGQTIIISGRRQGRFLHFNPASGSEGAVHLSKLRQAAKDADVNLIMLNTAGGRQPGARNWLWQRSSVKGLDVAMRQPTMADFLDKISSSQQKTVVKVTPETGGRIHLETTPLPRDSLLPSADGFTDAIAEGVSHLAGEIVNTGIAASMTSEDRHEELKLRFIPGIPSIYQISYIGLLIMGLLGLTVSRGWWRRLWPLEARGEYAGRIGYYAARFTRGLAYVMFFLPFTAPLALPVHFFKQLWHWLTMPARAWRWVRARWSAA